MAEELVDPAADPRARYDYRGGADDPPARLVALDAIVDGDVRFDSYTRQLFATDASLYEITPIGVVFPRNAEDVARVMTHCAEHHIPVLPRGAGTSLAGQAVNEAVVLDFSRYMDDLVSVSPEEQRCVAEPGIVLAELDEAIAHTGLKFAPDPAWGDKSVLGGAIGNNSTGAHSLAYGKTDQYIESCEVVLADGTRTTFGWCTLEEVSERADPEGDLEARIYACVDRLVNEEAETIEEAFPDIHRNVSGYNLDQLIIEAKEGRVNLGRLLAGSEGTLAIVTAAEIGLEPVPETTGVVLLLYDELLESMADLEAIIEHGPAAVELVDDVLLDLARETEEFGPVAESLPDESEAVLLVEFYAASADEASDQIAGLIADRFDGETDLDVPEDAMKTDAPRRATGAQVAGSAAEQARFWKLRKSGLPILLSRTGDEKHVAFIEDTAVPVGNLADYVSDVQAVLDDHDTFASYYAHAGPGCLHIRPLINTKTAEGVESMHAIAERITDLVVEYGGSISGEHGDGRARSQWNNKQYGEEVFALFTELKAAFDPDGLLNPGQVCGDVDMTEHHRFGPDYAFESPLEPELRWDIDNGFQGMVELCHGCGGCRGEQSTTGATMCPTYRASHEEITSTRGRANMLRQAMSGSLPDELLDDPAFMQEVLDLCIGCKGCARDCPSEVDMAKLKAEVTHAYQQRHGVGRRTRLFANIHRLSALGSATAPLSNWVKALPGSNWLAERTIGIARERSVPAFERESFLDWANNRTIDVRDEPTDRVYLLPDTFTNYHEPHIAKAAVRLLERAGIAVEVPQSFVPSGRAAYSLGRLDIARERAEAVIEAVDPIVEAGGTVISLEPSDAVMIQTDYRSLLADEALGSVPENTLDFAEYVVDRDVDLPSTDGQRRVTYHGHCHQKAMGRAMPATVMLERAGFEVDILDSGCCGMAGSFGYEAEHYSMSMAIGEILAEQVASSDGELVAAPGASCRTQLDDVRGEKPRHPVELVVSAIE